MSSFAPMPADVPAHFIYLIYGETGSGKSHGALTLASGIARGGKIAVICTEPKGMVMNRQRAAFDVSFVEPPFNSKKLLPLMEEAAKSGYRVVVVDCLTDFYDGPGGMMDQKHAADIANPKGQFANHKIVSDICNEINRSALFSGCDVIFTCFARYGVKQLPDKTIIDTFGPRIKNRIPERADFVIVTEKISEHGRPDRYVAWFDKNRYQAPVLEADLSAEYVTGKLLPFLKGLSTQQVETARTSTPQTFHAVKGKALPDRGAYQLTCSNEYLVLNNCVAVDLPCTITATARPFMHKGQPLTMDLNGRKVPVFEADAWEIEPEVGPDGSREVGPSHHEQEYGAEEPALFGGER